MPAALSDAMNASSVLSACAGMAMPTMAARLVRVTGTSFIAHLSVIVAEWRSARISCRQLLRTAALRRADSAPNPTTCLTAPAPPEKAHPRHVAGRRIAFWRLEFRVLA
jgi:hypothetical protein